MKKIIIGARGSKLSLAYVNKVKVAILKQNKELDEKNISFKTIKTSGDIFHDKKLSEIGGKNLFCKEIEENLLNKNIDIAIHSLKDMESQENNNLIIGAYIERNDPRDVFISSKYKNLKDLKEGAVVGSSSRRRQLQLRFINKNVSIKDIRGNVDTRIKKIDEGELDALILAAAGVKSLGLEKKIKNIFSIDEVLPAAGQGIIAVQCRKEDSNVLKILKKINSYETNCCAIAERSMLKTIGGDCETAVGGLAKLENKKIRLKAQLFSDNGKFFFNYENIGDQNEASEIGKKVGEELLKLAGNKFKKK
jgi:hydroxymethylbilane synthase